MQIEELDEFQGLTPEMVQKLLRKHGFDMRMGGLLHAGGFLAHWSPDETVIASLEASLYAVARYRNQSVQALLREINPRLRSWPSREARAAHDGLWLVVVDDETGAIGRFLNDVPWFSFDSDDNGNGERILTEEDSFAMYWPCDEQGNKVRWPEKDGVML